ncbi:PepSY-associated TM helix domain-containing protein [Chitinimonas sp.]|uniref:PepSY-associated TM helix domain-containing protein n=1 Tax=Chitinimonas sp. TaxID=1934313 RepID=UPI0035B2F807
MIASLTASNHTGFVPDSLRKGSFLKWLKRVHAWLGLWGALLGLLFGVSGFLLNHRAQMKINASVPVESTVQVNLPEEARRDPKAFAQWFADYTGIHEQPRSRVQPSKAVLWNGQKLQKPAEWSVSFSRPDYGLQASFSVGNTQAEVRRVEHNLWGMLNNLHKGVGLGTAWILLVDTLAGALLVLCLSGFLLWSKLHGPRLLALGLMSGAVSWAAWALLM